MSAPTPARALARAGEPAPEPCDALILPHHERWLRRAVLEASGGLRVLVDLPEATALAHGDRLLLEDGRAVAVEAAPEPLAELRATDALHLARLAWHLGNRHLPARIEQGRILIRRDHVIEDMARRLGAEVERIEAPFEPEGGAYGHGGTHAHGHAHSHAHGHAHD